MYVFYFFFKFIIKVYWVWDTIDYPIIFLNGLGNINHNPMSYWIGPFELRT